DQRRAGLRRGGKLRRAWAVHERIDRDETDHQAEHRERGDDCDELARTGRPPPGRRGLLRLASPVGRGREGVVDPLEQAGERRGYERTEAQGRLAELVDRGLAVLAGVEVRDNLLVARLLELSVQVGREEGQQSGALLGERGFVEPAELELLA